MVSTHKEHYSAFREERNPTILTTRTNLEGPVRSEVSQTQTDGRCRTLSRDESPVATLRIGGGAGRRTGLNRRSSAGVGAESRLCEHIMMDARHGRLFESTECTTPSTS